MACEGILRGAWAAVAIPSSAPAWAVLFFRRRVGDAGGFPSSGADLLGGGIAEVLAHLVRERLKPFHDLRVSGGDVGGLADVVFEVEERQADVAGAGLGGDAAVGADLGRLAIIVGEVELPLAAADGLE